MCEGLLVLGELGRSRLNINARLLTLNRREPRRDRRQCRLVAFQLWTLEIIGRQPGLMLHQTISLTVMILSATLASAIQWNNRSGDENKTTLPLLLNVDVSGEEMSLIWSFNQTTTQIFGFRVRITDLDGNTQYKSPILQVSETEMVIRFQPEEDSLVCLEVLANITTIIHNKCEKVNLSIQRVVVGILAGAVFLIPCIIGLIFIIVKDQKKKRPERSSLPKYDRINSPDKIYVKITNIQGVANAIENNNDAVNEHRSKIQSITATGIDNTAFNIDSKNNPMKTGIISDRVTLDSQDSKNSM
ncbi:hypothetical protein MAR_027436, partial [Mya arenaria]